MFTALFSSIGIIGFIDFLKSAIFLVGYISNNQLFPEPLSPEEEKKCLELMAQGDEEAKNILIERNLRLVAHICKKYTTTNVEQDDLISIGTIGLIKGINSFEPTKGVRLATYVARCIDNAHLTLRNTLQYFKQHLMLCKVKFKQNTRFNLQTLVEHYQK